MIAQGNHVLLPHDFERVADAIGFLAANWRRQPSLSETAAAAGLSEFHFQRLFRRWVGISPKQFTQVLTIERARALLADARSLLETSLEVGLSGPGRLHDLFVTVDAVSPEEFKRRGEGLRIDYGLHDSPFGRCLIGVTKRGVCWLSFPEHRREADALRPLRRAWPDAEIRRGPAATRPVAERAFALRQRASHEPIRVFVRGTNFQIKVWEALVRIPEGRVAAYEDVAAALGRPGAARAVGSAAANNPVSFLIPCHRVIRKTGVVGEYGWGPRRKLAMLAWEAARRESPQRF